MAVTYRDAGVDIDRGDELVERIKPLAQKTRTAHVLEGIGGFAGLCDIPKDIADPVLVSGTDGVGTKLKVAFATGKHDTIGQDLVAMCVNDVVTTGARPLFFLDYFGCGRLDLGVAEAVVGSIAHGCELAECALLGGETAELPGMYTDGEYDLAGFSVGVVARASILGPKRVMPDDVLIGVAASGLHSNGYSLARTVAERAGIAFSDHVPELGGTLGDVYLTPTRIYVKAVRELLARVGSDVHALCHVTGGGIVGNLPRVLPKGLVADVRLPKERPPVFDWLARTGPVEPDEMAKTFNLGVGLIAVVSRSALGAALAALTSAGERAFELGALRAGNANAASWVELS
ncbi:MAG: phosphoribosylformylglycinamidine cyclo-ligase [Polyangiaceae bacterium]|nr:phosphoribosylformylglycinamidine cyclo-ligase [Polyangiaceae bacterium]